MRLRMTMGLDLLGEADLARALRDALVVWREVPFQVHGTPELYDALAAWGCAVNGELVRFPPPVIDRVLGAIAEERARRLALPPEPRPDGLAMYTHGQALSICDARTNALRPATREDLAAWCRLVDSFGDLDRAHPTFIPTDVPRQAADFLTFATIILNSRRPHRVSVYSARMVPLFIRALEVVSGSPEEARRDPVFAAKCWVTTPFRITRENVEIALGARRLAGMPFTFGHMPVAGGSSPVTVMGSLVQNTAESLGLCAMRLALEGRVHEVTATSAVMDMRHLAQRQSGPELLLHATAAAQMNEKLFGTRPAPSLQWVSAQSVSPQSVFEKAMGAALSFAAGSRSLGVGCLAYSDVGSPVQLLIDYEMAGWFRHLLREVSADGEHEGLRTILETAPRGAYYLESSHTARFYREETWLSGLLDPRATLAWAGDPTDMIERARERVLGMMARAENQCPLSDDRRRAIEELCAEAERLAATA